MKALIIANGTIPGQAIVKKLIKDADVVVCADGGADHARRLKIKPDVILGDLDSITSGTKKYFKGIPLMLIDDQESSDLEKAIEFCIQRKMTSVDVIGSFGSRIDHATGSLGCFKKFRNRVELHLYDEEGWLSLVPGTISLRMKRGEKLSLIPLDRCEGVTTKNLKFPLKDDVLELGVHEGVSNEALSSGVEINVRRGTLLLYRFTVTRNK